MCSACLGVLVARRMARESEDGVIPVSWAIETLVTPIPKNSAMSFRSSDTLGLRLNGSMLASRPTGFDSVMAPNHIMVPIRLQCD